MPDETQVSIVPLVPGIHEDIDRTLAPPGTLVRAANVRVRKGGIAKRNALVDAGLVLQDDSTIANTADALGFAASRQMFVAGGRVYARQKTGDKWQEVGRASRARPVTTHWQGFPGLHVACAASSSYIVFAEYNGAPAGSGVRVYVQDEAGLRRQIAEFVDRDRPRVFLVGTTFVLVMRDPVGANIYGVTINGSTLAVSAETLVAFLVNGGDIFDAAPFSSTQWLLLRRSASTTMTVQLYNTSFAGGNFQNLTVASNDVTAACVFGTSGENIFATWSQAAASVQQIAAYAPDLSSAIFGVTTFSTIASATPAVMARRDATSVWLVYEEVFSNPTRYRLNVRAYDEVIGQITSANAFAWHVRPASRPFLGSVTGMSMWLHTAQGTEWLAQRRYTLATLAMSEDVPPDFGMFVEPEFSPDEIASEQQVFHVPEVAFRGTTDEAGNSVQRGYFPALSIIRTQGSADGAGASVLYEWDTEGGFDARARQVIEFGTQALVSGGGLQELPSSRVSPVDLGTLARGSENGFVFAPAILDADVVAFGGSGLSPTEQYFACAVFEYITADGLRIQSEPSNIVGPLTPPDAANDAIELKITTAPTSEREFSSPPCRTVLHVYFTVGNGDVFLRATPDAGIDARGAAATGVVTFTHNTPDATMLGHEPLYTDQGDRANKPAPAHRFAWSGGGRVAVGGLFNPRIVEFSKLALPNETARFTRHGAFRCLMPAPATGGAWLDGAHIVFSRDAIWTIPVTGSDDKSPGVGQAQQLPSTVGCVDFRSVCVTHLGVGFQSRRGYEILPRGFGEPRLISGPVQESLRGRRVISAAVVAHSGSDFGAAERVGERLLVLSAIGPLVGGVDAGVRLVYDLDFERWLSVDPGMADSGTVGEILTAWSGRLVVASRAGLALRYEDPTNYGPIEAGAVSLGIADARPFGAMNRGQGFTVQLLGEIRTEADITATVYFDGKYSEAFKLGVFEARGKKGDKFVAEWPLPRSEFSALGVDLSVAGHPDENGEGLVLHALGVEVKGLAGRPRVGQDRTV